LASVIWRFRSRVIISRLFDFHAFDIDVFASWALEGKQFESRIFRLYAEQPHTRPAFGTIWPFNRIGMRSRRLVCLHAVLPSPAGALSSTSCRHLLCREPASLWLNQGDRLLLAGLALEGALFLSRACGCHSDQVGTAGAMRAFHGGVELIEVEGRFLLSEL
jgi:hypothetical protein